MTGRSEITKQPTCEYDLAWALTEAAKPYVGEEYRRHLFVKIGAGDTFKAICELLPILSLQTGRRIETGNPGSKVEVTFAGSCDLVVAHLTQGNGEAGQKILAAADFAGP